MREKNTNSDLSDIRAFTAHIRSGDYLEIRLVSNHPTIVIDAGCWILDVNQRVLAFN